MSGASELMLSILIIVVDAMYIVGTSIILIEQYRAKKDENHWYNFVSEAERREATERLHNYIFRPTSLPPGQWCDMGMTTTEVFDGMPDGIYRVQQRSRWNT